MGPINMGSWYTNLLAPGSLNLTQLADLYDTYVGSYMYWNQIFFYTWVVIFSIDGLAFIYCFMACCGCCCCDNSTNSSTEQENKEPIIMEEVKQSSWIGEKLNCQQIHG